MTRRVGDRHRTAFITGAASGLGRAFAGMLAAEGVSVWGTSRDLSRLATPPGPPGGFTPVVLDLRDAVQAEAAYLRAAAGAGGSFDLVINNAGYGLFGDFAATGAEAWQAQLEVLLVSTARLAHAAYRSMRERSRGCLVNVSSLAAEFPLPYMSGYNAAKAGLSALGESLIFESRGTGVTVIDFRPGDYRTGFNDAMQAASAPGAPVSPALAPAWRRLDGIFRAAPPPAKAAADLRRALLRDRSGTVRSGTFFQARLAPFFVRFMPDSLRRAVIRRYFQGA